jgi:formylglycine-generating enzyme required for sulfatase activity
MLRRFIVVVGLLMVGSLWAEEVKLSIVHIDQEVQVSFQTESGIDYKILTTSDINSNVWVAGPPINGTGKISTIQQSARDPAKTFFKVEEIDLPLTIADLVGGMVSIPSGTFVMGSPDNEARRGSDEGPQTTVTISKSFSMSKYEVTQGQYTELMDFNSSRFINAGLNAPMEDASWEKAVEFCRRLTEQERSSGRLDPGYEYRLPTEAQWEYACRAGTTTWFSFGHDPTYSELGKYAWYKDNSGNTTHPVGMKLPNPWGLYDMHGNVWEMCQDLYTESHAGGNLTDPVGKLTVPTGSSRGWRRVNRGGSWGDLARLSRSADRNWFPQGFQNQGHGFRPVLVPVDYPKSPE